jgi:hypothetical protein
MKIALCLSGLARTFSKCYQSYIDNIISQYDCDVFIYVSKDKNSDAMNLIRSVDKIVLETDPVLDERDYAKYKKHKRYSVQGLLQQFWKIKMCHERMLDYQKRNSLHYDWVIRCRPDLMITRKIDDLSKLDNKVMYIPIYTELMSVKNRKIYYPLDRPFEYNMATCLPDRFAIATPEIMCAYASRYNEIETLVNRTKILFAEHSICQHLMHHDIKIQFLEPMYYIQR